MPNPLLQTKLYIPSTRANLVPRTRLVQRLNSGLSHDSTSFARKLSLISAPAGFGKTTLMTEWLAQQEQATAWIALDATVLQLFGSGRSSDSWRWAIALWIIAITAGDSGQVAGHGLHQ